MRNAERVYKEVGTSDGEYEAPRIELLVSEDGIRREGHYSDKGIPAGQQKGGSQGAP